MRAIWESMEEALWKSADKLRGSVEPAEYKHVVLSLFFLKSVSYTHLVQIWLLTSAGLEVSVWNWKQTKDFVFSTTSIVWEKKALSTLILRKQEKRDTILRIISAPTQWNLKRTISRWETVMEDVYKRQAISWLNLLSRNQRIMRDSSLRTGQPRGDV